ncbi:helix-turn-helix domain-containing protein [Pseudonocardia humida]|uniref:Helix-turn-helix domain-containing protein n=1 Tax=Pseudonocardia humida TaxID=2800819 RepID=A0ABT0ZYK9_9PSEU|nr:helix-turn-helix transcriptional regulator [Pseudonocardia humida]MCO1655760.1 helix-turn-helix domain-containing protein [Pseudonocardia humida]
MAGLRPGHEENGTELEDPAAMRRRLRVELKRLRTAAGKTQRDVAQALYWSPSKVIRIESGQVGITVTDLRALAALYGLADEEQLAALTEMAQGSKRQPFAEFRDVLSPDTIKYYGYEASASLIRQVEPLLVPGLLQTEEYTRAILQSSSKISSEEIDRIVESRRNRQELLERETRPEVFVLLGEAVFRQAVGGVEVMRSQLEHLLALNDNGVASIRVLPFELNAHDGMRGPYVHMEFPDVADPDVVFLEHSRGTSSFSDDLALTADYQEKFFALEDIAAPAKAFRTYFDRAIDSFSGGST